MSFTTMPAGRFSMVLSIILAEPFDLLLVLDALRDVPAETPTGWLRLRRLSPNRHLPSMASTSGMVGQRVVEDEPVAFGFLWVVDAVILFQHFLAACVFDVSSW